MAQPPAAAKASPQTRSNARRIRCSQGGSASLSRYRAPAAGVYMVSCPSSQRIRYRVEDPLPIRSWTVPLRGHARSTRALPRHDHRPRDPLLTSRSALVSRVLRGLPSTAPQVVPRKRSGWRASGSKARQSNPVARPRVVGAAPRSPRHRADDRRPAQGGRSDAHALTG
jgi:hypothetical protein